MWGVIKVTEGSMNPQLFDRHYRPVLFPDNVFGGDNEDAAAAPHQIRIHWGGDPVDTDIVNGSSGCYFRRCAWVREFLMRHGFVAGDKVVVERLPSDEYHVYPFRHAGVGIQDNA